ncbi:MAG: CBS domain-containing protein, partial [Nitrososphaerota archaeon]|nr:CBS domain-containing protein [Nitrososphaerales archaeon]MDW8045426.1 CBS domain-containing protein [Nitrososphaerota archaeon]
ERGIGSLIVTKGGKPVGIVTERDILYKVVAEGKDPLKTPLKEIMSSPIISVPKGTTVREALSIMVRHNFRRLLIRDGDRIVGIISQRSCVGDVKKNAISIELELPKGIKCPYCNSVFPDKEALYRHIDRIHILEVLFAPT